MDNYIVKEGDTYGVHNGKFDLVIGEITRTDVHFVVKGEEDKPRFMTRAQFHHLMWEGSLMLLSRAS